MEEKNIAEEINFKVEGEFVGKQRPRLTTINGHPRAFTSKKTINYENLVRLSYLEKYPNTKFDDNAALIVVISVIYPIEKKHYGKKGLNKEGKLKEGFYIRPAKKPDIDNIAKSILDALNGVAYRDDNQVCELHVAKWYHEGNPLVKVSIYKTRYCSST